MKTQILKKLTAAAVLICFLNASSARANLFINPFLAPHASNFSASVLIGSPYHVINTFSCKVKIAYTIYKVAGGCTPCFAGTQVLSTGLNNITIPAMCAPACDISITLTEIDGTALFIPITVSSTAPSSSNACNTCGCGHTALTYHLAWSPTQTVIN